MSLIRRISCLFLVTLLASCGGGGSLSDNEDTTDNGGSSGSDAITLTLQISDSNVSEQNPATITATVMQGDSALSGRSVTFTINNTDLAFFSPEVGTASTDANGIATIDINAGETAGSGEVTATLDEVTSSPVAFDSQGDGNTGGLPNVADVSLFASSQQMASDGSQGITLTAIAKNADNNLIEGVTVTFAADSGQLEIVNAVTGPDGKATATLKTDNEPNNRVITTTATSGPESDTVTVQVIGTTVSLTGSTSLAINDENSYIIKVLDSNSTGIANTVVALSLTGLSTTTPSGAVAAITIPTSVTTDFTGQATVVVTGTSGGTNSIQASALGATASQDVAVQADSFLFTGFDDGNNTSVDPSAVPVPVIPDVLLSKTASLTLTWLRAGVPVPDGTTVNFSSTRGQLAAFSATTIAGKVTATVTSDNAGKALVTFTGTDGSIVLNNQMEFEFIAETVQSVVAQAFPKTVGPSGQTSTISVVVKDAAGNLVKNKIIDFKLSDTNTGSIFPANAVTDSSGSASTVYTSNSVSAQNGISVKATVREDPTQSDVVTLTVADRELFISLGTGNNIIEVDSSTYNKEYSVFVTDVDSNPVENVTLTVSAIPDRFYKGKWHAIFKGDEFVKWSARGKNDSAGSTIDVPKHGCANEDLNFDGILDADEDTNNDSRLTPGNIVAAAGQVTTDDQGRAVIDILYPQSFAQWADIDLILSTRVSGTESFTKTTFTLPVLGDDVTNEDITPPVSSIGLNSPFGLEPDCAITD